MTNQRGKPEIRKQMKIKRDSLNGEEREAKGRAVQLAFVGTDEYKNAQRLCCYVSVGSEVSTRLLIEDSLKQGKSVTIPLLDPKTKDVRIYELKDASFIRDPAFSIMMDPGDDSRVEFLDHATKQGSSDIIVAPGIAFGKSGYRIGSGNGYYDRDILPAQKGALFVGFCYDEQLVPELPREPHDVPVHIIVTPTRKIML